MCLRLLTTAASSSANCTIWGDNPPHHTKTALTAGTGCTFRGPGTTFTLDQLATNFRVLKATDFMMLTTTLRSDDLLEWLIELAENYYTQQPHLLQGRIQIRTGVEWWHPGMSECGAWPFLSLWRHEWHRPSQPCVMKRTGDCQPGKLTKPPRPAFRRESHCGGHESGAAWLDAITSPTSFPGGWADITQ